MGMREKINEAPKAVGGVILVMLVAAAILIYANSRNAAAGSVLKMYYSDDNGATYFADSTNKVFPFDHNGRPAYRATVFQGSGSPFVGYLSRYADSAKAQLDALNGKENDPGSAEIISKVRNGGVQIKRPADTQWVAESSAEGMKIQYVHSSDGSPLHEVLP